MPRRMGLVGVRHHCITASMKIAKAWNGSRCPTRSTLRVRYWRYEGGSSRRERATTVYPHCNADVLLRSGPRMTATRPCVTKPTRRQVLANSSKLSPSSRQRQTRRQVGTQSHGAGSRPDSRATEGREFRASSWGGGLLLQQRSLSWTRLACPNIVSSPPRSCADGQGPALGACSPVSGS